jgi:hypothetical protein
VLGERIIDKILHPEFELIPKTAISAHLLDKFCVCLKGKSLFKLQLSKSLPICLVGGCVYFEKAAD